MVAITRREGLAGLAAGGVAAAWFGWRAAADESALIRRVIERSVGPFAMDEPQFLDFLDDFHDTYGGQNKFKVAAFRVLSSTGMPAEHLLPLKVQDMKTTLERKVVTHFLTRTNYLQRENPSQMIELAADVGCSSPFARFEPV